MARIEVLLSDEFDELLRKRADAEQSTISDCVRTLIERVLTGLDEDSPDEDEDQLRAGFAELARNYPSMRQELFEDDPDLRLDDPFEPDVEHDGPVASSMSTTKRAFTGHLTDLPILVAEGNVGQHWPEICDLEQIELRVVAQDAEA